MNRQRFFHPRIQITQVMIVLFLWLMVYNTADGRRCWVDFYEYPQYSGAHIRLAGPINLANLQIHGQNWDSKIDSLKVGKDARTTLFELPDFELANSELYQDPDLMRGLGVTSEYGSQQTGLTFNPGDLVEHLGVWGFHKKARSLTIDCVRTKMR